jgi:hypothetical protein
MWDKHSDFRFEPRVLSPARPELFLGRQWDLAYRKSIVASRADLHNRFLVSINELLLWRYPERATWEKIGALSPIGMQSLLGVLSLLAFRSWSLASECHLGIYKRSPTGLGTPVGCMTHGHSPDNGGAPCSSSGARDIVRHPEAIWRPL